MQPARLLIFLVRLRALATGVQNFFCALQCTRHAPSESCAVKTAIRLIPLGDGKPLSVHHCETADVALAASRLPDAGERLFSRA